jgi:hypothetical protein
MEYFTTKEDLQKTIEEYGVAVIPRVLTDEECFNMVSGIWDYFEHISKEWEIPINRNNSATLRGIYNLFPLHSMLFQYFNVGHAQVSWDMRQNLKIIEIFAHFWKCDANDLLVSFDGLSFNPPPEMTKRGWNLNNTWYHTDQSYTRNNFECIQSWVTGIDVEEGDATLAFMEGSNKYHEDFKNFFTAADATKVFKKDDWYILSREEEQFYIDRGCAYKKITCPRGSLVFWDSRTIHCGVEACRGRKYPSFRAVIYLCYTPKYLCSEANRRKRINAFQELRTTNHYPHKPKLFPKNPRTYGAALPKINTINPPIIFDIGQSLVG